MRAPEELASRQLRAPLQDALVQLQIFTQKNLRDRALVREINDVIQTLRGALKDADPTFGKKAFLDAFAESTAGARIPIQTWMRLMTSASFENGLAGLRRTFGSVDRVPGARDWYVFNLGGNNLRMIATVDYQKRQVAIYSISSHGKYDTWEKNVKGRPQQILQF